MSDRMPHHAGGSRAGYGVIMNHHVMSYRIDVLNRRVMSYPTEALNRHFMG